MNWLNMQVLLVREIYNHLSKNILKKFFSQELSLYRLFTQEQNRINKKIKWLVLKHTKTSNTTLIPFIITTSSRKNPHKILTNFSTFAFYPTNSYLAHNLKINVELLSYLIKMNIYWRHYNSQWITNFVYFGQSICFW